MLVTIFIILLIIFAVYWAYHPNLRELRTEVKGRLGSAPKLSDAQFQILKQEVPYYRCLREGQKVHFKERVEQFIYLKTFIPRGLELTDEMVIKISASAIQLTFGFPNIYFSHFEKILIYPTAYYSRITRQYHAGEVSPFGHIILSWEHFERGNADLGDGRNTGLHEMAHAFCLENSIANDEYHYLGWRVYGKYQDMAFAQIDKIRKGRDQFFRPYAGTNDDEFFACAIEEFFERPHQFYAHTPELYDMMCKLLKQDPREVNACMLEQS
ncbi:zinc-dependent peptidase [Persicobacter sp. CCB-QB2]|uniref:zinc-dependent peptidase n=1 Tax=Persicobacter sp. CCB-QB2 TaxID=1561025 RepID=UPI00092E3DCA|nr:zinc-dependent peptidase [Persicobacter sp. CCB-QB2]